MFVRQEQNELFDHLRQRSQFLADIYFGGLQVLADPENPTRFPLAAHAFREVISHCRSLTGSPITYGDSMKVRLAPVRAAFNVMAGKRLTDVSGDSNQIPPSLFNALQDYFEWESNNRPEARKGTALLLAHLAGPGPALPSDVVAADILSWMDSDEFFKKVAHHQKRAAETEFMGKLFAIENILLRRLQPRPVSDLDEIDRLIQEGEDAD